jgi:hypothetical protein
MVYSLDTLRDMPDLAIGQADSLKVEKIGVRVWLSRCTVADGEPFDNKVTVERFHARSGEWREAYTYQAE